MASATVCGVTPPPTPWPEWVSAIAAVVALGLGLWSWLGSRREARKAEHAARESAETAERAADAAERSAAALEKQADRFVPHWSVRRSNSNLVYLTNETGADAHDVLVSLDDPWYFAVGENWTAGRTDANSSLSFAQVTQRSSEAFFVTTDGDPTDAYLVVTWSRSSNGPRETWRVPALSLMTD